MASPRVLVRPVREIAYRTRPQVLKRKLAPLTQSRHASNDQKAPNTAPEAQDSRAKGAKENHSLHVTEEAAAIDKAMGETPPDVSQGTPVEDILSRDKDAQKNAPQVIKDQMNGTGQKRSYSTSARRMAEVSESVVGQNNMLRGIEYPDAGPGHKFPIPEPASLGKLSHLKRRYDPVVDQVTKSIMQHGKLSVAQKNMSEILNYLRTAPPPQPNPQYPNRTLLLATPITPTIPNQPPSSPRSRLSPSLQALQPQQNTPQTALTTLPRATLPLHPIEYLTTIIDSVAPLVKIRQQKGLAGGGANTPIPVPLGVRQRRRQAIQWILAAADGRRELKLAERVAKELIRVAEGSSGVWEKREMVHRLGVGARSNVRLAGRRR